MADETKAFFFYQPAVVKRRRRRGDSERPKWSIMFIVFCTAVFLFDSVFPIWETFAFTPAYAFSQPWTFISSIFLHANFEHLFFNMFVLWIFGCEVERSWGTKAFVKYYFIIGIGAGVLGFIGYFATNVPMIGASGAVYGVILAFALMFPERVITLLLFFVLPISMKAKYFAMMLAGISIFSSLFNGADGVAHLAHLGGMLAGYLYLKTDWRKQSFFDQLKSKVIKRPPRMQVYRSVKKSHRSEKMNDFDLQKQVDLILDKINEVGYEKLSRAEKDILKRASEDLSNKSNSK